MRAAVLVALCGCSFQPGQLGTSTGDADTTRDDGGVDDGALVDARPIDARPDAPPDAPPPQPATTDHAATADTFLASDVPTGNFNAQTSALVDGDTLRVVVMKFDLSAISTNSVVTAANLHIWTDFDQGADVTIYPLLQSWDETQATWNQRANGMNWTTAGAAPPSRGTTAVGTVNPTSAATGYVVPITAATVQGWVATPANNHGIVFVTNQADGTRFSTREHANTAVRPFLRVTHVP